MDECGRMRTGLDGVEGCGRAWTGVDECGRVWTGEDEHG